MKRFAKLACSLIFAVTLPGLASAADTEKLRVGVLKFGTVNWEMDVIKQHQLAEKHGVDLEVIDLASGDASTVALQGGAVDVIVSDFVWVARQRASGQDLTMAPYSNALGALVTAPDANIKTLADLKGKKLGIAGGPYDKSWLMLRAYAQKELNLDLAKAVTTQFAAPPLLNELIKKGDLDAVLNFWPYASRLQAEGMNTLIALPEVLEGLGIKGDLPLLGWVFSESWAAKHTEAVKGFIDASYEAKTIMKSDDAEWDRLRPRMKAENDDVFNALKSAYRAGIPSCFGDKSKQTARDAFAQLAAIGGEKLVGKAKEVDDGVFWSGFNLPACD